jgi:hypothetical protein
MAKIFSVSIENSEKELIEWVTKQQQDGNISLSAVLRDALVQKKKEWDISNSDSPLVLHKRIELLKQTIGHFNKFIEKGNLLPQWFDFMEKVGPTEDKPKELKQ